MQTKLGNIVIIVSAIIAVVAIAVAAYLFGQSQQSANVGEKSAISIQISPGPTVEDLQTDIDDVIQQIPQATTQPAPTSVVVFEASGSIPTMDKTQLMQRIVEPFVDYYKEQDKDRHIVSLSIGKNTGTNGDAYPYQGKAIFSDGVNSGFLIAKKEENIDWWLPECMQCLFSPQFSTKYPEIVSRFNQ